MDDLLDKNELNKVKIEYKIHERFGILAEETKKITKISTNKFTSDQTKDLLELIYDENNMNFINPFDNKVIIIDEIHNLTSRIVSGSIIGLRLYELLMRAKNMNIILLSGTPAINTPYQLAVTFNILKGTTTIFKYDIKNHTDSMDELKKKLYEHPLIDRWKIVGKSVQFTAVRDGFVNNFKDADEGTTEPEKLRNGIVSDSMIFGINFKELFKKFFIENGFMGEISVKHKSLFPDCLEDNVGVHSLLNKKLLEEKKNDFNIKYVNSDKFEINQQFKVDFQKRIVGLVSHYNEISIEGEDVFPSVTFAEDSKVKCELSDYQFLIYMNKRLKESELEEQSMKLSILNGDSQSLSYYKVLTRQSGNFVFPIYLPRPEPSEFRKLKNENTAKFLKQKEILTLLLNETDEDGVYTREQIINKICDKMLKAAENQKKLGGLDVPGSFKNIYIELINSLELEKKIQSADFEVTEVTDGCKDIVGENFDNIKLLDFNDVDELIDKTNLLDLDNYEEVLEKNINQLSESNLTLEPSEVYNLQTLSPKFVKILQNIYDTPGLVFGYSQFKAAEGVGIFIKVLEMNGYTKLILSDTSTEIEVDKMVRYFIDDVTQWKTDKVKNIDGDFIELYDNPVKIKKENVFLCKFTTWAGETTTEDREAILSLFNQNNNKYGQQCLILLGTSAISEGISLKYVRQVHIFEPYWNEIRVKQVIGRARRFKSHVELSEDQRNVEVFNYYTSFSDKQKSTDIVEVLEKTLVKDEDNKYFKDSASKSHFQNEFEENKSSFISIITKDDSLTSDESLKKISEKKTRLLTDFLKVMKETSIDCDFNKADNIRSNPEEYSSLECLELMSSNLSEKYDTTHTYDFEPISGDIIQQKKIKLKKMLISYNKYKILFLIPEQYNSINEYLKEGFSVYGYNFYKYFNLEKAINPLYNEEIIGELIIDFKGDLVFNFSKNSNKIKGISVNNKFRGSTDYYRKIQLIIDTYFSDLLTLNEKPAITKKVTEIKKKYTEQYGDESLDTTGTVDTGSVVDITTSKTGDSGSVVDTTTSKTGDSGSSVDTTASKTEKSVWTCPLCKTLNNVGEDCSIPSCSMTFKKYAFIQKKKKKSKKPATSTASLGTSSLVSSSYSYSSKPGAQVPKPAEPVLDLTKSVLDLTKSGIELVESVVKMYAGGNIGDDITLHSYPLARDPALAQAHPELTNLQIFTNTGGGQNDCLIHSFLQLTSDTFRKLDSSKRNSVASDFRRNFLLGWYSKSENNQELITKIKTWEEERRNVRSFVDLITELKNGNLEMDNDLLMYFCLKIGINLIFIQPQMGGTALSLVQIKHNNLENSNYYIIKNDINHFEAIYNPGTIYIDETDEEFQYLVTYFEKKNPSNLVCPYREGQKVIFEETEYIIIDIRWKDLGPTDQQRPFEAIPCESFTLKNSSDGTVKENVNEKDITPF